MSQTERAKQEGKQKEVRIFDDAKPAGFACPDSGCGVIGATSNKLGGRGKCRYCGKEYNNVAYHEAHECKESGATDDKREEGA